MKTKLNGYFLITALIAVALVASVTLMFMKQAEQMARVQRATDAASVEAREMNQLGEAARAYVKANKANWRDGERIEIGVDLLIAGSFLPEGFGDRLNAGIGTTPLGQDYRVVTIVSSASDLPLPLRTARTVVFQASQPIDGALALVGVGATERALGNFHLEAAKIGGSLGSVTGYLDRDARVVRGISTTFTKDISEWVGSGNPPLFAVLVGFPDLEPSGPNTSSEPKYTNCGIVDGTTGCDHLLPSITGSIRPYEQCRNALVGYRQPSCSASLTEVRRWRIGTRFSLVDTPIGTLTTGSEEVNTPRPPINCNGEVVPVPPSVYIYGITTLNNATALRQLLEFREYGDASFVPPQNSCPGVVSGGQWPSDDESYNLLCCELVPTP